MAITIKASGSQTCTIGTEHSLASYTDGEVYILALDLANLADGSTPDILEVRIYSKTRSGDTERLANMWTFVGSQSLPYFSTYPHVTGASYRATIKQTQGTGRAIPWSIMTVG